jgi:uncharacterized protein YndB with AHSA1/START domain
VVAAESKTTATVVRMNECMDLSIANIALLIKLMHVRRYALPSSYAIMSIMQNPTPITIETTVHAPIEKVWQYWTEPQHIMQWNNASDDWHTPRATNDLREGGTFVARMEAKDGSMGFDFGGTYTKVMEHKQIDFTMGDGRKVSVLFDSHDDHTHITETFDAESKNPPEFQRQGWQAILDNFKKYTESH